MSRHFSITSFFRQVPNSLLERYFRRCDLFPELDFSTLGETKPDALLAAWEELPDAVRERHLTVFKEIFDLSCEKGVKAILDEATWWLRSDADALQAFTDELGAMPDHYHRAMNTWLGHHDFWRGAVYFHHADSLSYWRKRKNLGNRPAAVDDDSLGELAALIRTHFQTKEARGRNCVVEVFRRGERDYFFAYPEDYPQQSVEWVDGEFGRRPHNPAFEIVYVYSQADGTLDVNYRGPRPSLLPLQLAFARAILKREELPPELADDRVYDLGPLARRDFSFAYSVGGPVIDVRVRKLRLAAVHAPGTRIQVEAEPYPNRDAVYDLLEDIKKGIYFNLYRVSQVELVAMIDAGQDQKPKRRTIRITYPNSCALGYDDADLSLRSMLVESGIEPTVQPAPAPEPEPAGA